MTMTGTRTTRPVAAVVTVGLLAALVVCGAGCGKADLKNRYDAERMAWQAGKLAQAMRSNPELATDDVRAEVERSYEAIVRRFPPAGEPLTEEARDVALIAGRSRLTLAAIAAERGDMDRAIELFASVRDSYAFDRGLAVEARLAAGNAYEAADRWPAAAREYEALVTAWPPAADPSAPPDPRILRTPLKVAAGYAVRGEQALAVEGFAKARAYYDRWIREWEGSPTAKLALELKGEAFAQEGRFAEAAETFELLDARHGDVKNRAAIWLRLAEIYSTGLRQTAKARDYYLKVAEAYPEGTPGATASIAIAGLDIEGGKYAQARARLEQTLARFKDEPTVAATAMHYLALSLELAGDWEGAAVRYNALAQEHPTTLYGLTAPLRVARHYRDAGAADAAARAFERAVQQYERVIAGSESTPAELAARNYLVEARMEQGEWAKAAEVLVETAARFAQSDAAPGMLMQAAELYASKLNDTGKAREALEKILAAYQGSGAAEEAAARLEALKE
jgi:TolA-binding protein